MIIRKNENVVDEMCTIMEQLHTYVPTVSVTKELPVEGTGDSVLLDDYNFHRILVGGD